MKNQPATTQNEKEKTSSVRTYIFWTSFILFLALMLTFFAGLLPIKPIVIATGSMQPNIEVGDVVLVCNTDPASLKTGDVIQYQIDNYTVIHRIVSIENDYFVTQGDANNAPDSSPVLNSQIKGKVICTIPDIGKITMWLHNTVDN